MWYSDVELWFVASPAGGVRSYLHFHSPVGGWICDLMGTVVGQNNVMRSNVLAQPGFELLSVRPYPAQTQLSTFLYSKGKAFPIQTSTGP
jgi:hypothetical protein